ncbi:MAG: lycopene cyclase family protein [Bernardetiaceae bacterium]
MHTHYDYIIAGGGGSGLSLLLALCADPAFAQKRILVIDRDEKTRNDRTWSFWATPTEYAHMDIPHEDTKCWGHFTVRTDKREIERSFAPYQYYCLRSQDYYAYVRERVKACPHVSVDWLQTSITYLTSGLVETQQGAFTASWVFSSLPTRTTIPDYHLDQRFVGWWIRTESPVFDPSTVCLMDFREQSPLNFMYILPHTSTTALVELTAFAADRSRLPAFDTQIKQYLDQHYPGVCYTITEREMGNIPMTNARPLPAPSGVVHLGMAGGCTKATTGYTFKNIQRHSQSIVAALREQRTPTHWESDRRFAFYDRVLLHLLTHNGAEAADKVFAPVFSAPQVFQFLDERTSLWQEWGILRRLWWPMFLKAAYESYFAPTVYHPTHAPTTAYASS